MKNVWISNKSHGPYNHRAYVLEISHPELFVCLQHFTGCLSRQMARVARPLTDVVESSAFMKALRQLEILQQAGTIPTYPAEVGTKVPCVVILVSALRDSGPEIYVLSGEGVYDVLTRNIVAGLNGAINDLIPYKRMVLVRVFELHSRSSHPHAKIQKTQGWMLRWSLKIHKDSVESQRFSELRG